MKLLSSQLFTIASQQVLVICWVQISGFYCLWATAESTLSRNSPLSWEFHHLGGWHSEESRQAGGGRRLPASISASQHLTAALSFSSSILFRNLGILKTAGCIPWECWGPIVILIRFSSLFLDVLSTLLAELSEERTVQATSDAYLFCQQTYKEIYNVLGSVSEGGTHTVRYILSCECNGPLSEDCPLENFHTFHCSLSFSCFTLPTTQWNSQETS